MADDWDNPKLWGANVFNSKTRKWVWIPNKPKRKKKKKKGSK